MPARVPEPRRPRPEIAEPIADPPHKLPPCPPTSPNNLPGPSQRTIWKSSKRSKRLAAPVALAKVNSGRESDT